MASEPRQHSPESPDIFYISPVVSVHIKVPALVLLKTYLCYVAEIPTESLPAHQLGLFCFIIPHNTKAIVK